MTLSKDIIHKVHGNGLGDQLLDILGGIVVAIMLGRKAHSIVWNTISGGYNNILGILLYDMRLFDFTDIPVDIQFYTDESYVTLQHDKIPYTELQFVNPSASSSPRKVWKWLKELSVDVPTMEETIDLYHNLAHNIKPSSVIKPYLLKMTNDEIVIGVHLRFGEKVIHDCTNNVSVNVNDHNVIVDMAIHDVLERIEENKNAVVFICGDNQSWNSEFKERLMHANENIKIISPPDIDQNIEAEYIGIRAVRDMFCLSQCDIIIQTVGYSTFSLIASLIGGKTLQNYWVGKGKTLQYMWIKQDFPPLTEIAESATSYPLLTTYNSCSS